MFAELFIEAISGMLCLTLHIENKNLFPKPLSAKEEKECFERMSKGDKSAKNKIIEHNLRLVAHIIKKYGTNIKEQEDFISIGTIGLIKAVSSFKGDKNIKMATYASRCIENEILMYLRKTGKEKREISLEDPLSSDTDGNELSLADVLPAEGDDVSHRVDAEDEKSVLLLALAKLPEREQQIMDMRFGLTHEKEMTQKEVADELDISQSYISRLEKKIMQVLKRKIQEKI
jgi:RNA polymerase sporulation-specific sigma factor